MRRIPALFLALTACNQAQQVTEATETDQTQPSTGTNSATTTGEQSTQSEQEQPTTSQNDSSSAEPREVWNPAPCPKGWIRPSAGQVDLRILQIGDTELPSYLDLYKTYPKAHAYGNCIQIVDNKVAKVHLEFGPAVQGYPQSWVKLSFEEGERAYEIAVNANQSVPEGMPSYDLSYTHSFEAPDQSKPRLQTWIAGERGADYRELHQLDVTWVSSMPGHLLELSNKSFIHKSSAQGGLETDLGLGFRVGLRLPGGPATPTPKFCATLNTQARCNTFDCGTLIRSQTITDPKSCAAQVQAQCRLNDEVQSIKLRPGDAFTYYDPQDPSHLTTLARRYAFEKDTGPAPKGWQACTPGQVSPAACDCSCVNAGCRPQRLDQALEACGHPSPCQTVTSVFPGTSTQDWSDAQRCLLQSLVERKFGRYPMRFALQDWLHTVALHLTKSGKAILSTNLSEFDVPPLSDASLVWRHPQICDIAAPEVLEACLQTPAADCFVDDQGRFPSKELFINCAPLEQVDCAQ